MTLLHVTDIAVALDAGHLILFIFANAADAVHDVGMALEARTLGYPEISSGDDDFIRKLLCCKRQRMKKTIQCFRVILRDKTRWRVAIVADGHFAVAGLHPACVLVLHDVAVRAGGRPVRHVRGSSRVTEGEEAHAQQSPEQDCEQNRCDRTAHTHSTEHRPTTYHTDHTLLVAQVTSATATPTYGPRGSGVLWMYSHCTQVTQEQYMRRAIDLATENARSGRGGPFGALVVLGDRIVAEGTNLVTATIDPTAHAEIIAIRRACEALQTFQLTGCTLYTSCEPCPMCLGAIFWARPAAVYYAGTHEEAARAGFDDSFIYQQTRLSPHQRALPMTRICASLGARPFEVWQACTARVPY